MTFYKNEFDGFAPISDWDNDENFISYGITMEADSLVFPIAANQDVVLVVRIDNDDAANSFVANQTFAQLYDVTVPKLPPYPVWGVTSFRLTPAPPVSSNPSPSCVEQAIFIPRKLILLLDQTHKYALLVQAGTASVTMQVTFQ